MQEGSIAVINPLGLHARAAAQLVRLAGGFKSRIIIINRESDTYSDAKSLLNLLTLAAAMGSELILQVTGEDEIDAFAAVAELFSNGFGEIE